jgi:hypothetical protein
MKHARMILAVGAIALLAGTAEAQTVNWTYAEGGWANFDPDRGSSENGWFLGGASSLGQAPIHVFGEYGDFDRIDIWQVGAGWHGLLGKRADLFADGAFYDADFDDGFKIRFGVRWMVTRRIEINGNLAWTELDLTDNKGATANAIFDLTKRLGIGGGFAWGDDFSTSRVFARFNFGPPRG